MANTFDDILMKILAQSMVILRGTVVMPQLVTVDYQDAAKQKGDTINLPIPPTVNVTDVTPAPNQPTPQAITIETAKIELNQWKKTDFALTDKDVMEIQNDATPLTVQSSAAAMAANINAFLYSLYPAIYNIQGTPGTTPFGDDKPTDAVQCGRILNANLASMMSRRLVLNPDAYAAAELIPGYQDASAAADPMVVTDGVLGRKSGFDWYMDQAVPTHTAGTITTGLIAKTSTAQAIGLTSVVGTTAASTGAAALKTGDIILFAGDLQTYALTADATQAVAASDVTLAITPALKVALTGDEAITVKASHVVNLAFQRGAFAFASRPLQDVAATLGIKIDMSETLTDPLTGLTMRASVVRQHMQTSFMLDMLYGGNCIRPELGVRLAG